jgi:hypothetical protein
MDEINIEPTKSTPCLTYKDGILKISGQSYPENAMQFYQPVLEWVAKYLEQMEGAACFEFNLEYLNTSSSKCIMDLIDLMDSYFVQGKEIVINWFYETDNESLLECAEEFKEDVSVPFNIIPKEG